MVFTVYHGCKAPDAGSGEEKWWEYSCCIILESYLLRYGRSRNEDVESNLPILDVYAMASLVTIDGETHAVFISQCLLKILPNNLSKGPLVGLVLWGTNITCIEP